MVRLVVHSLLFACLLVGAALLVNCAFAKEQKREAKAAALVEALVRGDFAAGAKEFDATMKAVLPPKKLGETWKMLLNQVGAFKKHGTPQTGKVLTYDVVWIECQFEKATLYARVVFSADGEISGLQFTPTGPPTEYKPPAYVKRDVFTEVDVQVGKGEWVLPGTLAMPKGPGLFPAVVLVHGSGPNDRDETVLANKPFRDLAWGLASQGIAVLRYEKRTRQYRDKLAHMKGLTVKEEVLDDALAATALLRQTKKVDPSRVFVLGHSLGATAAPTIGQLDPHVAGLIILAAAGRPIEDLVVEQVEYSLSLVKEPTQEEKAKVDQIKKKVAQLKDPKLPAKDLAAGTLLKQPFAYWRSLHSLAPTEIAVKLHMPMLVLQGERDYQVSKTDFELWKRALAGRKDVMLKSYPRLNHLFMEGAGKSRPEEYTKEGHVAGYVVSDIATWIKRL